MDLRGTAPPLPRGTAGRPGTGSAHTRADLYPEPYAFRPERFLDERPTTYGWVPFGGGVRRCLGAAFAEFEMRVVLTEMLQRPTIEAPSAGADQVPRRNVTFSPRNGTRVIARIRSASRSRADAPAMTAA